MSGALVERAAKLVLRSSGRLTTMIVKKHLSYRELTRARDEIEEAATIIRKVLDTATSVS